jgi:hypothetical protein
MPLTTIYIPDRQGREYAMNAFSIASATFTPALDLEMR